MSVTLFAQKIEGAASTAVEAPGSPPKGGGGGSILLDACQNEGSTGQPPLNSKQRMQPAGSPQPCDSGL